MQIRSKAPGEGGSEQSGSPPRSFGCEPVGSIPVSEVQGWSIFCFVFFFRFRASHREEVVEGPYDSVGCSLHPSLLGGAARKVPATCSCRPGPLPRRAIPPSSPLNLILLEGTQTSASRNSCVLVFAYGPGIAVAAARECGQKRERNKHYCRVATIKR